MSKIHTKEIKTAVETAFSIPGLYRHDEAGFLYRLARRKGLLVELGCYLGRSTSLLVQAARVWKADVVSVDAFTVMPNNRTQASPEKWARNLKKAGLTPPELIAKTSDAALEDWTREISLLFIDANHEYDHVLTDLMGWTPHIKVGGVVALHDMFYPSITGVAHAVVDWWHTERDGNRPNWELIGLHDYTIAFRRIA
jgi:predicted O-methyltransferase YrrM